jgi:hypothetical protein
MDAYLDGPHMYFAILPRFPEIDNVEDFNRDRLVNAADQIIARNNYTFFDALKLITM